MKATDVAEYFLYVAAQNKRPITNKKIQKLVYYAQAWSLVLLKEPLFNDRIEAWVHGPAIRGLYAKYKSFWLNPIDVRIEKIPDAITKKIKGLLDEVWQVYGKFDAEYLEMLTHSEEPWQRARENMQPYESSRNEITRGSMKIFYGAKLQAARA